MWYRAVRGWLLAAAILTASPAAAPGALAQDAAAEHSVARLWNEALLQSIREDYARPTVHARNLYHLSVAMYDAWAVYDPVASPVLLGRTVRGFTCPMPGVPFATDVQEARKEAISFAAFELLRHRFQRSPGASAAMQRYDDLMDELGYDPVQEAGSDAGTLGRYIADCLIEFGHQDGANEQNSYENRYYEPVNPPLAPALPGNPDIVDPNRWQPLFLDLFIDQAGNPIPFNVPEFLSPEWGEVVPFSLSAEDLTFHRRDGYDYWVYHDPGPPPALDPVSGGGMSEFYRWGFTLVAVWSSHLDPTDGVTWDISPASLGNVQEFLPVESYHRFYDLTGGGDTGRGRRRNPVTGEPYNAQIVSRGDYTRVLAEFWADGPDSETPPGHWFTILNQVNDHPMLEKRYRGEGEVLGELEWDVKAYLALGGAMHDVAIASWAVKGRYDYIRPVSAIRYMASKGQSSDEHASDYDPAGLPLIEGYVERVEPGDPLAGAENEHVGKFKLYAWRGPDYVEDPAVDEAGVGWILAENWWPYQRPSFVTPPFAGYVSGHSTYSRAAAEVLTLMTGDEYFPGGVGRFEAPRNEFLVFEEGPSEDVVLEWATYRDASDQCSLSRIWGGIHPPADDIPGRKMGIIIGPQAFAKADSFFSGTAVTTEDRPRAPEAPLSVYPNPARADAGWTLSLPGGSHSVAMYDVAGRRVFEQPIRPDVIEMKIPSHGLAPGVYVVTVISENGVESRPVVKLGR